MHFTMYLAFCIVLLGQAFSAPFTGPHIYKRTHYVEPDHDVNEPFIFDKVKNLTILPPVDQTDSLRTSEKLRLIPQTYEGSRTDKLEELKPEINIALFYGEHEDYTKNQQAAVGEYVVRHPTVALQQSTRVLSVSCANANELTVTVKDKETLDYIRKEWAPYSKDTDVDMVLVGFFDGCSPSFSDDERSWSIVHDFTYHEDEEKGKYRVSCDVEHKLIKDVITKGKMTFGVRPGISHAQMARRKKRGGLSGMWDKLIGKHDWEWGFKLFDFNYVMSPDSSTPFGRPGSALFQDGFHFIFCLDCRAEGRGALRGTVEWDHFHITGGKIEYEGFLNMTIDIGVQIVHKEYSPEKLHHEVSKKYNKELANINLLEMEIPGLCSVGPQLILNFRFATGILTIGHYEAGVRLEFPNPKITIDLGDPAKSKVSGLHGKITPILRASANVDVYAKVSTPIQFFFGIDLFAGEKKWGVQLEEELYLRLYLQLHVEGNDEIIRKILPNSFKHWEIGGTHIPQSCAGPKIVLECSATTILSIEYVYWVLLLKIPLFQWEMCLPPLNLPFLGENSLLPAHEPNMSSTSTRASLQVATSISYASVISSTGMISSTSSKETAEHNKSIPPVSSSSKAFKTKTLDTDTIQSYVPNSGTATTTSQIPITISSIPPGPAAHPSSSPTMTASPSDSIVRSDDYELLPRDITSSVIHELDTASTNDTSRVTLKSKRKSLQGIPEHLYTEDLLYTRADLASSRPGCIQEMTVQPEPPTTHRLQPTPMYPPPVVSGGAVTITNLGLDE